MSQQLTKADLDTLHKIFKQLHGNDPVQHENAGRLLARKLAALGVHPEQLSLQDANGAFVRSLNQIHSENTRLRLQSITLNNEITDLKKKLSRAESALKSARAAARGPKPKPPVDMFEHDAKLAEAERKLAEAQAKLAEAEKKGGRGYVEALAAEIADLKLKLFDADERATKLQAELTEAWKAPRVSPAQQEAERRAREYRKVIEYLAEFLDPRIVKICVYQGRMNASEQAVRGEATWSRRGEDRPPKDILGL